MHDDDSGRAECARTDDGAHDSADDSADDDLLGSGGSLTDEAGEGGAGSPARLTRAIALYTLIRVGIVAALVVLLMLVGRPFGLPLIVALAFAIVLQLPISVLLFRRQRQELTAALAWAKRHRTRERDRLREQLMGEEPLD